MNLCDHITINKRNFIVIKILKKKYILREIFYHSKRIKNSFSLGEKYSIVKKNMKWFIKNFKEAKRINGKLLYSEKYGYAAFYGSAGLLERCYINLGFEIIHSFS